MTGAALIFCTWLVAPTPAAVALLTADFHWRTSFFEELLPPCAPNEVPVQSFEECVRMKPNAIRWLRLQYPVVTAECVR